MRVGRALLVAGALVLATCGGSGGGDEGAATTLPSPDAARLSGATDAETAAAVSAARFPSASDVVITTRKAAGLASTAAYVAGSHQSPILLVDPDEVPGVTLQELKRLGAYHARVIGAVSGSVTDRLTKAGLQVDRIAGQGAVDAAADVALNSGTANIGVSPGRGRTAFLAPLTADGREAMLAGPLAFSQQWPVLFTDRASLPARTRDTLKALAVQHVVVLGADAAVGQRVLDGLKAMGVTTERVAGGDATALAAGLADLGARIGLPPPAVVDVVPLADPVAMLVAGPHAGTGIPLLACAKAGDCGPTTLAWLAAHKATVGRVVVVGAASRLSERARAALDAAAA